MTYKYDALNRLDKSLKATNVLSEDYRTDVFSLALLAVSQAYDAGRESVKPQGEIVTLGGRRFVKTGVNRLPKQDEWYLYCNSSVLQACSDHQTTDPDSVEILIPA